MKLKRYALLIENVVHEVIEVESIEGRYHSSLEFIEVGLEVTEGMFFDRTAGAFRPPKPAPGFDWDIKTAKWVDGRTPAEILSAYTAAVQGRLDEFARTRSYDGILSACSYATSTNAKFSAEGQYCVSARDETWETCYAIIAEVESGKRTMPTLGEIMAELPALDWPDANI